MWLLVIHLEAKSLSSGDLIEEFQRSHSKPLGVMHALAQIVAEAWPLGGLCIEDIVALAHLSRNPHAMLSECTSEVSRPLQVCRVAVRKDLIIQRDIEIMHAVVGGIAPSQNASPRHAADRRGDKSVTEQSAETRQAVDFWCADGAGTIIAGQRIRSLVICQQDQNIRPDCIRISNCAAE